MATELYSQYDFIILGEHPAALWGALTLLENGLKVLIVPLGQVAEKNFAPDFAVSSLQLDASVFPDRDLDPIQILTPERRFRLFSDADQLSEEHLFVFGKEFTSSLTRGLAFLHRGSETGPLVSEEWKTIFQKTKSTLYFLQEPGWLKKQFLKKIQQLGGHVLSDDAVHQIFIEKKTFVGVQIEGSSSLILGSQVLVGTQWDLAQSFFSEKTSLKSAPVGFSFEIQVQIEEESLPLGLTSYMIFVQDEAPIVEIHHSKKGHFLLRTTLPFQERFLGRLEQRKIAQRLFKVLGNFIPDLEYNLKRMVPDLRDPERAEQEELPRLYPFQTLSEIPPARLRYAVPGLGAQSPIQNMWFADEEAFPRAGEWGAYQAVAQAIQAWGKHTQKPELLKINAPL